MSRPIGSVLLAPSVALWWLSLSGSSKVKQLTLVGKLASILRQSIIDCFQGLIVVINHVCDSQSLCQYSFPFGSRDSRAKVNVFRLHPSDRRKCHRVEKPFTGALNHGRACLRDNKDIIGPKPRYQLAHRQHGSCHFRVPCKVPCLPWASFELDRLPVPRQCLWQFEVVSLK